MPQSPTICRARPLLKMWRSCYFNYSEFPAAPAVGAGYCTTEGFVASIEFSQLRKGMVIVGDDKQLYTVVDRDLNTPGNWRAILQLKLKNLKTGSITQNRVRPQDKVEVAYLEKKDFQYLYKEGDDYIFMDSETYDQFPLSAEFVGDQMKYLK